MPITVVQIVDDADLSARISREHVKVAGVWIHVYKADMGTDVSRRARVEVPELVQVADSGLESARAMVQANWEVSSYSDTS